MDPYESTTKMKGNKGFEHRSIGDFRWMMCRQITPSRRLPGRPPRDHVSGAPEWGDASELPVDHQGPI